MNNPRALPPTDEPSSQPVAVAVVWGTERERCGEAFHDLLQRLGPTYRIVGTTIVTGPTKPFNKADREAPDVIGWQKGTGWEWIARKAPPERKAAPTAGLSEAPRPPSAARLIR